MQFNLKRVSARYEKLWNLERYNIGLWLAVKNVKCQRKKIIAIVMFSSEILKRKTQEGLTKIV